MANIIYHKIFEVLLADPTVDFNDDLTVVRALLERSTSTYTPDPDHDFLNDVVDAAGWAELSTVISPTYARKTVTTKTVTIDNAGAAGRVEWSFDPIQFGNLESGQIVKAVILYVQVGGSDATPSNDPLICRIDTATGLTGGATLGGGAFTVTPNAEGVIQFSQGM